MKSNRILALRQRKITLVAAQRAILAAADNDGARDLNEAEAAKYDDNVRALTSLEGQIEREEQLMASERSIGAVTDDNRVAAGTDAIVTDVATDAPTPKGFASFGEMLVAVAASSRTNGRVTDPRLFAGSPPSGMNEAVPSDGGFLVQKEFSSTLLKRTYETGQISSRVNRVPIGADKNGLKINAIDEDSRADGSRMGGILAYWINEADTKIASKPKFRQIELNLNKIIGLCYATDELLEDAVALQAIIETAFPEELNFKVEDAIINGTGSGQPLGIMNSASLLTVARDAGDVGVTASTADILNMWSRCWGRSRQNAVWFINQDVEPKLYPLTLGSGTAVQLFYTPPGQNGNQYGKLLGRDVIPVEHSATLGTPGDILLADLSQYLMIDKTPTSASSIHVRFVNDETTFRFVYRVDGQPAWKKPLTPKNGVNTYSPFVALATRS